MTSNSKSVSTCLQFHNTRRTEQHVFGKGFQSPLIVQWPSTHRRYLVPLSLLRGTSWYIPSNSGYSLWKSGSQNVQPPLLSICVNGYYIKLHVCCTEFMKYVVSVWRAGLCTQCVKNVEINISPLVLTFKYGTN